MNRLRRSLVMAVLCTSGGAIYNLPYVFEIWFIPMQQAMDLSKTQMGVLMGVFGGVSIAAAGRRDGLPMKPVAAPVQPGATSWSDWYPGKAASWVP